MTIAVSTLVIAAGCIGLGVLSGCAIHALRWGWRVARTFVPLQHQLRLERLASCDWAQRKVQQPGGANLNLQRRYEQTKI